ncbi:MAG TPA: 6-carboxytetrahydropterin synthase [Kofleriaceae bacterium]|nr:6-carboxytetrahydropterin synthase [Kofleriaceae bacterium]
MTHRIRIARAEHKFSCAHMTVFADGTKERLHGHNYTVAIAIEVERVDVAAMVPFAPIKAAIAELCAAWRERVLLAAGNPWFEVIGDSDGDELEFRLCGARYVMPRGDVLLLPIDNVSVEALAAHAAALLRDRLIALGLPHVLALEVAIEESPGQGASCALPLR